MTAPMLMTDCPTPETIAAFVDDTLDDLTRRKTTEHIASCGECRELVNLTTDFQATNNVQRWPVGWITAASLAAAAVLTIFVLRPDFVFGPNMEDVRVAAQSLDRRPTEGRLNGEFPHKERESTNRGGGEKESGVSRLWIIAAETNDPHVEGVARLHNVINRPTYEEAIKTLREAYEKAPPRKRDDIAIDLAAALLSRWGDEDGRREALKLSDEVLARARRPEAAWNRAAALEALGEDQRALQAWDDYRKLDPNSEWAQEAAERQRKIREFL